MSIWYPYTQHKNMLEPLLVKETRGTQLILEDGRQLIDGIASWWCMVHGYNPPSILDAISQQLTTMPHVMLGGLTHLSAQQAATAIASEMATQPSHVFFSDSGSVGVEVALKMALGYQYHRGYTQKRAFIALRRGYHGDTIAAMGVGDPQDGLHPDYCLHYVKTHFLPAPPEGLTPDKDVIKTYIDQTHDFIQSVSAQCAALIVEPIIQGAGGFHIYSPEILNAFRLLCDQYQICLIADEVASGFFRTGHWLASNMANVIPDIVVMGKGLTGGVIGHAATIAQPHIFETYLSDSSKTAFMHGPTFMANPLATTAISASITLAKQNNYPALIPTIESALKTSLFPLSQSPKVKQVRVLGAMGVVECHNESDLIGLTEFAIQNGVWLRPIGPYLYTMPPYTINSTELRKITDVISNWILN